MLNHPFVAVLFLATVATSFNFTTTKLWSNVVYEDNFPEKARLEDVPNNGLCFVGGGNRAYTASVGYLRALEELDLLDQIRYVVGVSGGSWALTAFLYRNSTNQTNHEFLSQEATGPAEMTLDSLAKVPDSRTMLHALTLAPTFLNTAFGGDVDKLVQLLLNPPPSPSTQYTDLISSIYLEPFGIEGSSPYTLDVATEAEIKARNRHLNTTRFVFPNNPRPFPITLGALLGPVASAPFANNNTQNIYRSIEFTPLYAGSPIVFDDLEFVSANNDKINVRFGGYVEPFAFGGARIVDDGIPNVEPSGFGTGIAGVNLTDRVTLSIAGQTAISSMAVGGGYSTMSRDVSNLTALGLKPWSLVPQFSMFPTSNFANDTTESTDMLVADGGIFENSGVIALVRRGVENIVVFDNTESPLDSNSNLLSLFGAPMNQSAAPSHNYNYNQIFELESLAELKDQLQKHIDDGHDAVATVSLTTVTNSLWGVRANHKVKLTWFYLHASQSFLSKLPEETKQEVDKGADGIFANFPHFDTFEQFALSPSQTQLLAGLTHHIGSEYGGAFYSALDIPAPTKKGNGVETATIIIAVLAAVVLVALGVYVKRNNCFLKDHYRATL